MELQTIRKQSVQELAQNMIRQYILTNHLQTGDPLPTEMVLAEKLSISRNILREALSEFRSSGLLVSRPRKGTVVGKLQPENPYQPYMPFMAHTEHQLRELADVRTVLETGAVPLIIQHATEEKTACLREVFEDMKKAKGRRAVLENDMRFHTLLLQIPENTILNSLIPLLVQFFTENTENVKKKKSRSADKVIAEHRAILEAVENRDAKALRKSIIEHSKHYL